MAPKATLHALPTAELESFISHAKSCTGSFTVCNHAKDDAQVMWFFVDPVKCTSHATSPTGSHNCCHQEKESTTMACCRKPHVKKDNKDSHVMCIPRATTI